MPSSDPAALAGDAESILRVEQLSRRFGGLVALDQVSFAAPRKKVLSIVGPNGAGKTTLFNVISGVLKPDGGSVVFDREDVTGFAAHKLAAMGIARTFQNVRLFRKLNTLENVMVGRSCRTSSGVLDAVLSLNKDRRERKESTEYAEQMLRLVGVQDKRFHLPSELPYGDQRRVEIARALATDPKLLILDEPTQGMVAQEARQMVDLMGRLAERGVSLLLIEHNMTVVMSVSHSIVVLNFGRKIAEGPPSAIRNDPRVIEAYLGAPV